VATEEHIQALAGRLGRLEAAQAVRNTLARYMALCDQPCNDKAFPQLADLFTPDAVWEGVQRSAATFGRHQGRAAVAAFVQSYLAPSSHFTRNLHFTTSEQVHVSADGAGARGAWLMLQLSAYGAGGAQAISARLEIDFRPAADGRWLIAHFRTERLDCVPWHDSGAIAASEVAA
jgi:ketosteroid isomerase-like protein